MTFRDEMQAIREQTRDLEDRLAERERELDEAQGALTAASAERQTGSHRALESARAAVRDEHEASRKQETRRHAREVEALTTALDEARREADSLRLSLEKARASAAALEGEPARIRTRQLETALSIARRDAADARIALTRAPSATPAVDEIGPAAIVGFLVGVVVAAAVALALLAALH